MLSPDQASAALFQIGERAPRDPTHHPTGRQCTWPEPPPRPEARRAPHPRDAEAALARLLGDAPVAPTPAGARRTFGEACDEWLRYVEHDRDRRPSTVGDYRNTVRRHLLPAFGADTPVREITTDDIDAFRERLLEEGRLSRRTIQKTRRVLMEAIDELEEHGGLTSDEAQRARDRLRKY